MTLYTTNYNLDKYESSDKPNLRDQYNSAMDKIDDVLKAQENKQTSDKQELENKQTQVKNELNQKINENKNEIDNKFETEKMRIVWGRLNVINATIPAKKLYATNLKAYTNYTNLSDRRRLTLQSRTEKLDLPFICQGVIPNFTSQEPVNINITNVAVKYNETLHETNERTYTLTGIEVTYDLSRLDPDQLLDAPLSITGGFYYTIIPDTNVITN